MDRFKSIAVFKAVADSADCAPVVGRRFLGRALATYAASYPRVWVDVGLQEPPLDPASNEADLTLCFAGELRDSLAARRVAEVQVGVYASPNYLVPNGAPLHPTDLERHDCLTCGERREREMAIVQCHYR